MVAWSRVSLVLCLAGIACGGASGEGEDELGDDESSSGSESESEGAASYQVELRFEGLRGSGLVLRQGSDELEITSLDAQSFPTSLLGGEGYEVEILAQPRWPTQSCVLEGASGVVADADVEVLVNCASVTPVGLDASYGDAGVVVLDDFSNFPGSGDVPVDLELTPGGGLIVAGRALSTNEFDGVLWRLGPDGSIDEGFADQGLLLHDAGQFESFVAAAVADDGSVYATGRRYQPMAGGDLLVVHVLADGSLDANFGVGGSVLVDNLLGGCPDQFVQDTALDLELTAAGLVIVGASAEPDCEEIDAFAVRLDPDTGAFDASFADAGVFSAQAVGVPEDARNDTATAVAPLADGGLWLAGVNAGEGVELESAALWRLDADGLLDGSFGEAGFASLAGVAGNSHAWDVVDLAGAGALLAGESHGETTALKLWRVDGSGGLDGSFADAGVITVDNAGRYVTARRVELDSLGRILVLGTRHNLAEDGDLAVWRFGPDGLLDEGFADGGLFVWTGDGREVGWGLAIDGEDRVLASASTVRGRSNVAMAILRIEG